MRYLTLWLTFAGLLLLRASAARAQTTAAPQTARATVRWGTYAEVSSPAGNRRKVPTFATAHHGPDEQIGTFALRLEGYVPAGEVRNAVYQPFSPADARLLDAAKLPAGPTPSLSHGTARKQAVSYLSLQPARRNPQSGQPEQLVSFDYVYTLTDADVAPTPPAQRKGTRPGSAEAHAYAPASVLASGDWFKIGVAESGIYKLDRATLSKLGLNPQQLDPRHLQLFGNATGLLPQPNAAPRPDDLVQNDVQLVGDNGNATFDDNEYLLFYARGPHVWQARNGLFQHVNNIYADTAYYFLTVGAAGRRVAPAPAVTPTGAAPTDITTFNERLVHEHDLINVLKSGRQWLGESFEDNGKFVKEFAGLPGLVAGAPLTITSSVASTAVAAPTFGLTVNEQPFGRPQTVPAVGTYAFHEVAQTNVTLHQGVMPTGASAELRVGLSYNSPNAPQSTGYLDYLEINTLRQLALSGPVLEFRSLVNNGTARVNRYMLGGATGATVWDVTNPCRPAAVALDASGSFLARTDTLREFVAFRPDAALPTPRVFGKVANQNLHALNTDGKLDLVIVAYPLFRAEAERLAAHRRRHNNLGVAVVTPQEVYNEYSSGAQDVTAIRDFMRQIYNRAPADKNLNLLLFGDASYDYKSKASNDSNFEPAWWKQERKPFGENSPDAFNQNYVPTYQSRESFSQFYGRFGGDGTASYSSEDYYGLLDENEGEWNELSLAPELMDVGVGRLPVRIPAGATAGSPAATEQARRMVDKLLAYDAAAGYGKWRNRVTLVSDDSDDGEGELFVGQGSEIIATELQVTDPAYNIHKVYLDLYPQFSLAAGQRSPAMNRAVDESFEQGSLIINYLGHGGPINLADEQILTPASVLALQNHNKLAFMVTGTCDFAAYDNPNYTSSGEKLLTDNEQLGGAIGLFTTTRLVEGNLNAGLNQVFFKRVFQPLPDGRRPGMGTVIMNAKNDYPQGGINNRNYTLLGDPSAALAYPEEQVALRALSLNGQPAAATDTLRALSRVKLEGEVHNSVGVAAGFSGTAQVTIFDKPAVVMTLINTSRPDDQSRPVTVQESIIYDGQATVRDGRFSLEFVVPKDINYSVGLGKVSLYAFDPARGTDAHGARPQAIGGANRNAVTDLTPPKIRMGLNDTTFASGGLTNLNPTLVARLSDESGINTTGAGIGHEITATLDRDPTKLVVLNDAYTAEVDNFRAGQVRYVLKDLAPGPHTLRLKAWDTHNNPAEREIEFIAASTEKLALGHVLNYPNPFSNVTQFHFDHNRSGEDLDVQVQIFTVTGRLVRTLRATVPASRPHEGSLSWNGRDDYDDQLARGVYVYRLSVRVGQDGPTASKYEKLVLLN
ncbi:type IX secretion system sortase PorU [uncultured Hymenobacter sp.]|uniref:type IX secretion system sortase PorU n=1 Tax=uncultured Hymenobacter sp. TaxID=170016 RepID=UPI0035C9B99B